MRRKGKLTYLYGLKFLLRPLLFPIIGWSICRYSSVCKLLGSLIKGCSSSLITHEEKGGIISCKSKYNRLAQLDESGTVEHMGTERLTCPHLVLRQRNESPPTCILIFVMQSLILEMNLVQIGLHKYVKKGYYHFFHQHFYLSTNVNQFEQ